MSMPDYFTPSPDTDPAALAACAAAARLIVAKASADVEALLAAVGDEEE